jgi:hypothetical protein
MKTSIFIAICCAMFALSSGAVRAQEETQVSDSNPDADTAVDASVHAGADEPAAQQAQPSRQPAKRPQASYSHWGFQSANQPSATRFEPDQAPGLLAQSRNGNENSELLNPVTRTEPPPPGIWWHSHNAPFRTTPVTGTTEPRDRQSAAVRGLLEHLNAESGTPDQSLRTENPVLFPYPLNNGFSMSLREKKLESPGTTAFPSSFSESSVSSSESPKGKPQTRSSSKSVSRSTPAPSLDSHAAKQN